MSERAPVEEYSAFTKQIALLESDLDAVGKAVDKKLAEIRSIEMVGSFEKDINAVISLARKLETHRNQITQEITELKKTERELHKALIEFKPKQMH